MTTMEKYIKDMKRLEKRIKRWDKVATLADRIYEYALAKYCGYAFEQEEIIRELNVGTTDYMEEIRKENNRRNFRIQNDL